MAFCPHCGKPVTEQATKCIACGNDLEPKAKSARFKGTMMMQPGTAAAPPASAPSAEAPAAAPANAPEQPKPAPAPPARPPTPAPSKVVKATMLGTGGAGLAPPGPLNLAAAARKPDAAKAAVPPPAAGGADAAKKPATSATNPALAETALQASMPGPSPAELAAAAANRGGASSGEAREDSKRFLVGDPMAPQASVARSERRGEHAADSGGEDSLRVQNTGKLLMIGVGGVLLIAAVGYAAARFMGLLN